jgi:hypothetical protein
VTPFREALCFANSHHFQLGRFPKAGSLLRTRDLVDSAVSCAGSVDFRARQNSKRPSRHTARWRLADRLLLRSPAHIADEWGNAVEIATGIGLLLKSWHNAFYRFGPYDPTRLAACVEENMTMLDTLHERALDSFSPDDEPHVRRLFSAFTVRQIGRAREHCRDWPPDSCPFGTTQ